MSTERFVHRLCSGGRRAELQAQRQEMPSSLSVLPFTSLGATKGLSASQFPLTKPRRDVLCENAHGRKSKGTGVGGRSRDGAK